MRKTIVSVAVAAAMVFCPAFWEPREDGPVHQSSVADCEEVDLQPCVTFDENEWRMVLSYDPYAYRRIDACRPVEHYPCLTRAADDTLIWNFRKRFLPR